MERVFLCVVFVLTCVTAQWTPQDFHTVETHLIQTQANIKQLYDTVQKEKIKMYGSNTLNGSIPAIGMGIAYGTFFNDMLVRLSDIENATRELTNYMQKCPDSPMAPPKPQNVLTETTTVDGVSTITISWDPLRIIPDNLQYKVYFQPLELDGTIAPTEVVFRICDASQTSASITDLAPRSRYRIRVAAVDGMVVESNSIPEIIHTPDVIPSPPVNLRGTAKGPNSIRLDWDPPIIRGEIVQYRVFIHDSYTLNNQTVDIRPAVNFLKIKDLTEGTTHVFSISAFSDNGESDQSDQLMVSTPGFVPAEVIRPFAKAYNTTTIRVTFKPPKKQEGKIRGYRVHYTDFLAEPEEGDVETNDPFAREMWIHNLQPNKDYYFSITAFTRRSASFPTSYVATKSKAAVPSQVRNVRCRVLRTDPPMIQLRWEPPLHMYALKKPEYHIMWGVKNGVFRNESITNMSVSWNSDYLDDNLLHRFVIAAKNDKGIGNEVEVQLKTPKREFDTPKNIKVGRMKEVNTTLLAVSWDPMPVPVMGFRVLHRVFQWIYQGRWTITEVPNPNARSTTIPITDPTLSYIVVVRAKLMNRRDRNRNNRRKKKNKDVMKCKIFFHKDKNAGATSVISAGNAGIDNQGSTGGGPGMGGGQGTVGGQGMVGEGSGSQGMGSQGMGGQGMGQQGMGGQGMGSQGMGQQGMGGQGMGGEPSIHGTGFTDQGPGSQGIGGQGMVGEPGIHGPGFNGQGPGSQGMGGQGMGGQGMGQQGMGGQGMGSQGMGQPGMGGQGMGGQDMGQQGMGGQGMGGQGMGQQGMGSQGMGQQGMGGPEMGGQGMGQQGMGGQGMGGQGMGGQGMGGQGMGGQGMGQQGMEGQGMGGQGMGQQRMGGQGNGGQGMGGQGQEFGSQGMGGQGQGMGGNNQGFSGINRDMQPPTRVPNVGGSQGLSGMGGSQGPGGNQGMSGMGGSQGIGGFPGMSGMGASQGMSGMGGSQGMSGNQGMGGNPIGQVMGGQGREGQGGFGGVNRDTPSQRGNQGMGSMGGSRGINGGMSMGMSPDMGGGQGFGPNSGMGGQGIDVGPGMGGGSGMSGMGTFHGVNSRIGTNQGMGGGNPNIPVPPTPLPPTSGGMGGGNQRFGQMPTNGPMGGMPQNNPMASNQGGMRNPRRQQNHRRANPRRFTGNSNLP
ncbi:Fibronectin type III domain-containing protein 2 [Mizuhopecten yessoensis]|uniref:Fibronectin type III domain-containing protein 2 n=2 Tax=Mizuhopecten yessoensis TaxID=6573 RepID=A0A210QRB4_MIZYE|nr:Fibronectin type III domain-containing protein 2 [Mizuhopecten yessoensis]